MFIKASMVILGYYQKLQLRNFTTICASILKLLKQHRALPRPSQPRLNPDSTPCQPIVQIVLLLK
jgi:hypothetical protein